MGAHPRQQHGGLDGLGHIVHGARLQSTFFVRDGVEGGHEDHRDLAGLRRGTQGSQHLVAVHLRHHHIEQDDVGHWLGVGDLQGLLSRVGHAHVVVRAQQLADDGQVFVGVVDDQYRSEQGFVIGRQKHSRGAFGLPGKEFALV